MNDKKSKNRIKKEEIVAEILDKKGKAKAIVFTNYQGLTHKQIEGLKKGVKSAEAEFVVAKNSLLQKAMTDIKELEALEGPTGTIFAYNDVIAPLKEIAKALKQFSLPTIKFGILDGKITTGEDLLKISNLPTKEVLIAQFVGGLKAPLNGLVNALTWEIRRFVVTLDQINKTRSNNTNVK